MSHLGLEVVHDDWAAGAGDEPDGGRAVNSKTRSHLTFSGIASNEPASALDTATTSAVDISLAGRARLNCRPSQQNGCQV